MKDDPVEKSFCTTREAATLLGVSVGTVQLWVENGLLQAWKTTGGHRRVLRESIDSLLHKSPTATPHGSATGAFQTRPLRILVVEDDDILLQLYLFKLSAWPMKPVVSLANNAVSGLLMMGRSNPDLLITDLNMPGMDGFNMLRVLHQTPDLSHTTIVVVSGLDAAGIASHGGIPGGIEVLNKPVPFERLETIASGIALRYQPVTTGD
jgi:excisionase family DNA binding protein